MLPRTAFRCVAGPSRLRPLALTLPITAVTALPRYPTRLLSTTLAASALRQDPKLPRGHVRPHRRAAMPNTPVEPYPEYDVPPPLGQDGTALTPSRPVYVPPDPQGVLGDSHAAKEILAHEYLVIVRQLEMLNVFMGFEQANRYAIHSPDGQHVGFLAEEEQGILSAVSRQALRTHRPFRSVVMDKHGTPVLWIRRPFAFINSRIFVHASEDQDSRLVGETQQEWHPWRRRYNLFQTRETETFRQFAKVDSGFLAWDFWLKDRDDRLVASINRNFRGLGRELFTDTGQYVIRFDSAGTELDLPPGSNVSLQGQSLVLPSGSEGGLTLDQRAMALATAVSIDFDYFSRHSGSGGMGFPFLFWGGGDGGMDATRGRPDAGSDVAGAAGAGAAGAAGVADVGSEGMNQDEQIYGRQPQSPREQGQDPNSDPYNQEGLEGYEEESGWGEDEVMQDPWSQGQGQDNGWFGSGGGGGGDGGDWGDWS